MQHSSTFCRAQEARQQILASGALLANVRGIAIIAAGAWAKEALIAERREKRAASREAVESAGATAHLHAPCLDDRSFSENPDRGCADAKRIRN